jgi:Transposase DDE domain
VDLDTFIVTVYCVLDDALKQLTAGIRLRQRGPAPHLADSEVLTIEVVGEYLGLDQDRALYAYFRRHHGALFPALARVDRTTFVRQAANLWRVKARLWQHLLDQIPYDPRLSLVDSFPVPVCRFGRAPRCRRFRGQAAFGRDTGSKATFYGFRDHLRVCWPGVVTALSLAPANLTDATLLPEVADGAAGDLLGDRAYWHPHLAAELASAGLVLLAPFRKRSRDPAPHRSHLLNRLRWRIETVAAQFVERYQMKRVWARDVWHLTSRVLRNVLSHTVCILLNCQADRPPLQLARLLG